jgi:uncharacterized protein (DUF2384 family)
LRAARVRNLGRALFTTDEAVSEWLSKPEQALGNMAPLDLLDTDFGAKASRQDNSKSGFRVSII